MVTNNDLVFTDIDLDGVGSYIVYTWKHGNAKIVKQVKVTAFREHLLNFLQQRKLSDFDRVWVFDIDTSEVQDLLDHSNVTIVDHHASHVDNAKNYKNAKTYVTEYTSTIKLLYNVLLKDEKLTKPQQKLITYIDDYDSYTLKYKESYILNLLYFNLSNRFDQFFSYFKGGYVKFSPEHDKLVNYHLKKIQKYLNNLEFYYTKLPVAGKPRLIVSTFADKYINDVADYTIKKFNPDLVFVINNQTQSVSVRRGKDCDIQVNEFARSINPTGGGHPAAGGFKMNETFLNLSKYFKKYAANSIRTTGTKGE